MSDPFERTADVGFPLADRGQAKAARRSNSIRIALPALAVIEGETYERWTHPETGAILLVPEGVDPTEVETPD